MQWHNTLHACQLQNSARQCCVVAANVSWTFWQTLLHSEQSAPLKLCCLLTATRTATNGKSDLLLCDTIMIRPKNSLIIRLRPLRQHATVVQWLRQPGLVTLVSIHVLNALGRSWLESAEGKLPKHGVYLPDI